MVRQGRHSSLGIAALSQPDYDREKLRARRRAARLCFKGGFVEQAQAIPWAWAARSAQAYHARVPLQSRCRGAHEVCQHWHACCECAQRPAARRSAWQSSAAAWRC